MKNTPPALRRAFPSAPSVTGGAAFPQSAMETTYNKCPNCGFEQARTMECLNCGQISDRPAFPSVPSVADPPWDYSDCLVWAARDFDGKWWRAADARALSQYDQATLMHRPSERKAPSVAESAEDARACADSIGHIYLEIESPAIETAEEEIEHKARAVAELEAFARSRVKPWREAVIEFTKGQAWADKAWKDQPHIKALFDLATAELLSADDAKEAAK